MSKHKKAPKPERWGLVYQIAWFRHHYPNDWSRPEYRTDDGIVPYKLFCLMVKASSANRAIERLNFLAAVQLGMATVQGGDNRALQRIREDTVREALGQD